MAREQSETYDAREQSKFYDSREQSEVRPVDRI